MTLKFTLSQIEGFLTMFSGDFINKVKEIANMASQLDFNSELLPNLLGLMGKIDNLGVIAREKQNSLIPYDQLTKMLTYISEIS